LNHEYNILKKAGSSLGHKHSDETRQIMAQSKKGEKCSDETRKKISDANYGKPRVAGSGTPSLFFFLAIEVFDNKTNQTTIFDSISEATRALNLPSHKTISNYILRNQVIPYKGQYIFKKT
jgi:group I intron endonuclease